METTLSEIRSYCPSPGRYHHLLAGLDPRPGGDEPIQLTTILEINGLDDVAWLLARRGWRPGDEPLPLIRRVLETAGLGEALGFVGCSPDETLLVRFAYDCAMRAVLRSWRNREYMRQRLAVVRCWLENPGYDEQKEVHRARDEYEDISAYVPDDEYESIEFEDVASDDNKNNTVWCSVDSVLAAADNEGMFGPARCAECAAEHAANAAEDTEAEIEWQKAHLLELLAVNGLDGEKWLLREKRELLIRIRLTCDYAERVVERYWTPEHPDDRRPHDAVEAAREWADDPTDENRRKAYAATRAAFTAALDALTAGTPATTRAIFAADAAYYAARVYADFAGYIADDLSLNAYEAVRRALDTIDADSADKRDLVWRAEHLREMLKEENWKP